MGSSKKQTVGHKILWGMHAVLSCGPIDKITRFIFDGKIGWEGSSDGGRIDVAAENLFGGEKREGGVSGAIDFENGEPTQGQNDYLLARLGSMISGFRGIAALVFRQTYWGLNPYMKPVMVRAQRIHRRTREGVEQWYDAKAQIGDTTTIDYAPFARTFVSDALGINPQMCIVDVSGGVIRAHYRKYKATGAIDANGDFVNPEDAALHSPNIMSHLFDADTGVYIGEGGLISASFWHPVLSGTKDYYGVGRINGRNLWVNIVQSPNRIFLDNVTTGLPATSLPFDGNLPPPVGSHSLRCVTTDPVRGKAFVIYAPDGSSTGTDDAVWYELDSAGVILRTGDVKAQTSVNLPGYGNATSYEYSCSFWDSENSTLLHAYGAGNGRVQIYTINNANELVLTKNLDSPGLGLSSFGFTRPSCWLIDGVAYAITGPNNALTAQQYLNRFNADVEITPGCANMNPAHIVREINTDPDNGLGYPEEDQDDSFATAADTLFDEGFGLSAFWEDSKRLHDFRSEVLRHIDAAHYVDRRTGKFVLKLIRPDYDPDTILVLDESVVDRVEGFARPKPDEIVNTVHVRFWDCETGNSNAMAMADDPALVQIQNGVVPQTIDYPWITNYTLAGRVAERDLRGLSLPLATCTVYANKAASVLNEGDPFKLVWPDTGVASIIMRVTHIAFGNGRSSRVRIQCVEDRFSMPATPIVIAPPPQWENPSQVPDPAEHRIVTEAPYYDLVQRLGQSNADNQLSLNEFAGFLVATGANPGAALNAELAVNDGTGYETAATVDFCPFAVIDAYTGQTDTVIAIRDGVDLDQITVGSHAQIGDELVRIDAVSETEITVGRGVLDTVPAVHTDGVKVFFWQEYADGDEREYGASATIDVKLLPVSGAGQVALAQATADQITFDQRAMRPYPPGNLRINSVLMPEIIPEGVELGLIEWSHRDRLQQTAGNIIDTTDGNIGPEAGTTYTLRIYDENDVLGFELTGITGTSHTYTEANELADMPASDSEFSERLNYRLRIELWSVRDSLDSWQKHSLEVFRDSASSSSGP